MRELSRTPVGVLAALTAAVVLAAAPRLARADVPAAPPAPPRDRFASEDPVCGDGRPESCARRCFAERDAAGCYELGRMFQYGSWDDARVVQRVSIDLWASRTLYLRACRAGDARGCNAVGYLYGTGATDVKRNPSAEVYANQVPRNYALAVKFYERSCAAGLPLGCFNVGVMYESGFGVRRDVAAAAMMYERACAAGNANACSSLGVFLYNGTSPVWSDPPRGIALLRKGCAGGNDWGCQQLKAYGYEP